MELLHYPFIRLSLVFQLPTASVCLLGSSFGSAGCLPEPPQLIFFHFAPSLCLWCKLFILQAKHGLELAL